MADANRCSKAVWLLKKDWVRALASPKASTMYNFSPSFVLGDPLQLLPAELRLHDACLN